MNTRVIYRPRPDRELVVREVAGYRPGLLPCARVYFHGDLTAYLVPTDELVVVEP